MRHLTINDAIKEHAVSRTLPRIQVRKWVRMGVILGVGGRRALRIVPKTGRFWRDSGNRAKSEGRRGHSAAPAQLRNRVQVAGQNGTYESIL